MEEENWWWRTWFYHTWFLKPKLGERELEELEYINDNIWVPQIVFKRWIILFSVAWIITTIIDIVTYKVVDWWLYTVAITQFISMVWYGICVFTYKRLTHAKLLSFYFNLTTIQYAFPLMFIFKNIECSANNYSFFSEKSCADPIQHEHFIIYMYLSSITTILVHESSIFLQTLVTLFLYVPAYIVGNKYSTLTPVGMKFSNRLLFLILTVMAIHVWGILFYQTKRTAFTLAKKLKNEMELRQRSTSYMFHEMRSPLNVIMLAVDQINNKELSDKTKPCIFIMENILNDSLDFQKISQGSFTLNTVSFSFNNMLQQAVNSVEPLWIAKHQTFSLKVAPEVYDLPYKVIGDQMRIRQIILNYLSNAVKYTEQRGTIMMHVSTSGVTSLSNNSDTINVHIAVTDSGVGIEEKDQLQLFKPFVQITNKLSGTVRGTGLGLSIVASLIEQMGGTYGVTSTLGVGSTFYCTIPLKVDKGHNVDTGYSKTTTTPNNSSLDVENGDLSALSPILVVDDNVLICNLVKEILTKWKIRVDVAHNGKEALDVLHQYYPNTCPYQVILMDDMMPVMFGQTAIKQLRAEGYMTPIIGITGNAEDADKILLYGADHVIIKPISKTRLMKTLAMIINQMNN